MSGKGGRNGLASDGVGRAVVVASHQSVGLWGPMVNAHNEFKSVQDDEKEETKEEKRYKIKKEDKNETGVHVFAPCATSSYAATMPDNDG